MITIKQVAKECGVTTHTIRFYEKEKLVQIPRNDHGIRDFDQTSIDTIKAIVHYRNVGMSLDDIKQVMENFDDHAFSLKLLKETKSNLDTKIKELEATREYLIYKIGLHQKLADQESKVI